MLEARNPDDFEDSMYDFLKRKDSLDIRYDEFTKQLINLGITDVSI